MKALIRLVHCVAGLVALLLASGCGTVTNLEPTQPGTHADLSRYTRVVVHPFTETVSTSVKDPAERSRIQTEAETATLRFREKVAEEIRLSGAFVEVFRGATNVPESIVIDGVVTRAVAGSKAKRFWVGFGAGNAYFDAKVEVRDGATGELLATLSADRNSWGGGGLIAAEQTLDSFIDEAAKKVAQDLAAAKVSGHLGPAGASAPAGQKPPATK